MSDQQPLIDGGAKTIRSLLKEIAELPENPGEEHLLALIQHAVEACAFWHGVAEGAIRRAEVAEAEIAKLQARPAQIAAALMEAASLERRAPDDAL